ncbi:Rubrerythrin [Dethiosulfovibrio salsuginis]|uniref:Rubrerythrin n=2 Tax=Dethiosulfovibrio salsuginis TaxID=561720 RepID=A0A1X7L596_9BACT|nr:Rubrerythrin [Dethiosulfovibrio salsuginis]
MGMRESLNLAIHAEMEASEFYLAWSENTDKDYLKRELLELSEWEKEHEEGLKKLYIKQFGEPFQRNPDIVVEPELKVQTSDFGDVTSLLRIASAAYLSEMRASELYGRMAEEASGETRDMFLKLKEMEENHMETAKKRYLAIREDFVGFKAF